jgi:CO/xanthine dehydrogenase Mo-binding subunit
MAQSKQKFVGRSVRRLEDRPLVTGGGRFAADISFPDQLHMRVVRSTYAHARILALRTSEAAALPGVHAVWTAADVTHIASACSRPIACVTWASRSRQCSPKAPMSQRTRPNW